MVDGIAYKGIKDGVIDPMLTVINKTKKSGSKNGSDGDDSLFLRVKTNVHSWRHLHLFAIGNGRPIIVRNLENAQGNVTLITAGLEFDAKSVSKPINEGEWQLKFPVEFLDSQFLTYKDGIDYAEIMESTLVNAILSYRSFLNITPKFEGKMKPNDSRAHVNTAVTLYWHNLHLNHNILIQECAGGDLANWKDFVKNTAIGVYDEICKSEGARTISAYVKGKRKFYEVEGSKSENAKKNKNSKKEI